MQQILESREENWKDIPDYEGLYQVSDLGRVKSFHKGKERVLKASINRCGYYQLTLYKDNKSKYFEVHQLMAIAFLNHKPNGNTLVVDHINNLSIDNRISNLQIISHRENATKDQTGGTSEYVGVSWCKNYEKWRAQIVINGKRKHLGYFKEELEAHKAYQEALTNLNNIG